MSRSATPSTSSVYCDAPGSTISRRPLPLRSSYATTNPRATCTPVAPTSGEVPKTVLKSIIALAGGIVVSPISNEAGKPPDTGTLSADSWKVWSAEIPNQTIAVASELGSVEGASEVTVPWMLVSVEGDPVSPERLPQPTP